LPVEVAAEENGAVVAVQEVSCTHRTSLSPFRPSKLLLEVAGLGELLARHTHLMARTAVLARCRHGAVAVALVVVGILASKQMGEPVVRAVAPLKRAVIFSTGLGPELAAGLRLTRILHLVGANTGTKEVTNGLRHRNQALGEEEQMRQGAPSMDLPAAVIVSPAVVVAGEPLTSAALP
jgi:hypothetical protein